MKLSTFLVAAMLPFASAVSEEAEPKNLRTEQRRLDDTGLNPTVTVSGVCFSAISQVQVAGKGVVAMRDLQVGDAVLTGSHSYEKVYAWGHYEPTVSTEFLSIETANNKLEITGQHMVYVHGKSNPVRADSIKVGTVLKGEQSGATVTDIKTITRQGLYAPLTPTGSVVVNGIVASNYISLQDSADEYIAMKDDSLHILSQHDFQHRAMSPFRMMCMGVHSTVCDHYNAEGMPHYVANAIAFAHWAEVQPLIFQLILLVAFSLVTGSCMVVESLVGAALAPLALLVAATGMYYFNKRSSRINKQKMV